MRAVSLKKWCLIMGVAVPLAIAGVWLVAAERGPFICDNGCQIAHPLPDEETAEYVEQMKPLFNQWFGEVFWNKGDIYIICNADYCAKYYITDNFGLYGTTDGRMTRTDGGAGSGYGGGGGAETGGSGGYNPAWSSGGSGGGVGGSGRVNVGDPSVVEN
ncbi:hypothetical protein SAMN04487938_1572 [Lysobacter sp. cf310]|nr:hypothetical protein SAMN04487938_1572 [Lysobacter sp. cf310]